MFGVFLFISVILVLMPEHDKFSEIVNGCKE